MFYRESSRGSSRVQRSNYGCRESKGSDVNLAQYFQIIALHKNIITLLYFFQAKSFQFVSF